MWMPTTDLPVSPGHPFYARLNAMLDATASTRSSKAQCQPFYAPGWAGRGWRPAGTSACCWSATSRASTPSAASPGAPRLAVAARASCGLGLDEPAPDHSTISRTRRLIDAGDASRGLHLGAGAPGRGRALKGRTVGVDSTTLEANAAMRSIVRRDTGERYQEYLTRLAKDRASRRRRARTWRGWTGSGRRGRRTRLEEPGRSGREDHQDEGRPHAPGPQSRARRSISTAGRWSR